MSKPKTKPKFGLIDVSAAEAENGMWYVSMTAHKSSDGDDSPEDYGSIQEHLNEKITKKNCKMLANMLVKLGTAKRVVVFVEGNEYYLKGKR